MTLPNLALCESQTRSDWRQENKNIIEPQSTTIQPESTHLVSASTLLKLQVDQTHSEFQTTSL